MKIAGLEVNAMVVLDLLRLPKNIPMPIANIQKGFDVKKLHSDIYIFGFRLIRRETAIDIYDVHFWHAQQ